MPKTIIKYHELIEIHIVHIDNGAYLYTGLAEVDAQAIRILGIVLDKLLQGSVNDQDGSILTQCYVNVKMSIYLPECCASGNEEAALIQLSDAVMLNRIAIAHCKKSNSILDRFSYKLAFHIHYSLNRLTFVMPFIAPT